MLRMDNVEDCGDLGPGERSDLLPILVVLNDYVSLRLRSVLSDAERA